MTDRPQAPTSVPPGKAQAILVLIDTHCHVHIEIDGKDEGPQHHRATTSQICCRTPSSGSTTTASPTAIMCHDDHTSSQDADRSTNMSLLSHRENNEVREGSDVPAAEVTFGIAHVTMGIQEDDWEKAIDFVDRGGGGGVISTGCHTRKAGGCRALGAAGKSGGEHPEEEEEMWAVTRETALLDCGFRFGIGLHPWSAHSRSQGWLRDLTALLEAHPEALVGEIGLDKVARTPDTHRVEWDDQVEVFNAQMVLAARLSRPVSVHCVKAYGKLVEILGGKDAGKKKRIHDRGNRDGSEGDAAGYEEDGAWAHGGRDKRLPPRVALHSFTGSVEVAKDLCRSSAEGSQIFFGFSAAVNLRTDRARQRLLNTLRVIPDSSILIETDRRNRAGAGEELMRVCDAIAEAKGVSPMEAADLANHNAGRFLSVLAVRANVSHLPVLS